MEELPLFDLVMRRGLIRRQAVEIDRVIATSDLAETVALGTFGGNPLAFAAALATINVLIEENLLARAHTLGKRMLAGMRDAVRNHEKTVVDVRGKGLMIALEFQDDQTGFKLGKLLLDRGVLVSGTLVNARVVRVEPPLTIEESQADYVCQALNDALRSMKRTLKVG